MRDTLRRYRCSNIQKISNADVTLYETEDSKIILRKDGKIEKRYNLENKKKVQKLMEYWLTEMTILQKIKDSDLLDCCNGSAFIVKMFGSEGPGSILLERCKMDCVEVVNSNRGECMREKNLVSTQLFSHIRKGLECIWNLGYVHNDIKPENIVVGFNDDDTLKIIDFGYSLPYHAPYSLVKDRGTKEYHPSWIHVGCEHMSSCGELLDIYGLCMTAIVLFIGKPPPLDWGEIKGLCEQKHKDWLNAKEREGDFRQEFQEQAENGANVILALFFHNAPFKIVSAASTLTGFLVPEASDLPNSPAVIMDAVLSRESLVDAIRVEVEEEEGANEGAKNLMLLSR